MTGEPEPSEVEHEDGSKWTPLKNEQGRVYAYRVVYSDGRVAIVPLCVD
jgi:hypothetical protein